MSTLRLATLVACGLALLAAQPGASIAQQSSSADDCNQPLRDAITYVTAGQPSRPIISPDGCWIFVESQGSLAVLRRSRGVIEQHSVLDIKGQVRGLTRDGKILVIATTEAIFIDVDKLLSGDKDVILGRATDAHFSARHVMGITTKDDYLFLVQNETEWVSVIDLNKVRAGAPGEAIVGGFATGYGTHLVLSPDQRFLYVSSGQSGGGGQVPVPRCTKTGNPLEQREGTILVVDVEQAKIRPHSAVIGGIRAACGGGIATSPDGALLYLAERLGDSLLVFDAKGVASGEASALIARVPVAERPAVSDPAVPVPARTWPGPTDVAVTDNGRKVVVKTLRQLTIIDAAGVQKGAGAILGTIPADLGSAGFPWMVTALPDGRTLVTELESGLAVIDVERLPLEATKPR